MHNTYIELSRYQSPEIINTEKEKAIKRGFQSFSLEHLGTKANDLLNLISENWEYSKIVVWLNNQPIIMRSKMIGVINTLFANRILQVTAMHNGEQLLCIEGLERTSKLIGKATSIVPNTKNIYMYHDEGSWCIESFSNKTLLRSGHTNQHIMNFIGTIQNKDKVRVNEKISRTEFFEDINYIYMLNEKVFGEYESSSSKKYWNFHDKLFDRRTRSWNDNVPRTGSYRFMPDKPPYPPTITSNSPLKFHKNADLINPLSRRVCQESIVITKHELKELCSRAFMDIKVDSQLETDEKYKKEKYRPYPSAGGIYELEIYIVAQDPEATTYSLLKYQSDLNNLTSIETEQSSIQRIADYVKKCWISETAPKYILLMVGNYAKLSYKYENIAYKLMLINTGCAVSSFYRACRSLSIGCCCTGCGPSDLIRGIIPNGGNLTPLMEIGFGKTNG